MIEKLESRALFSVVTITSSVLPDVHTPAHLVFSLPKADPSMGTPTNVKLVYVPSNTSVFKDTVTGFSENQTISQTLTATDNVAITGPDGTAGFAQSTQSGTETFNAGAAENTQTLTFGVPSAGYSTGNASAYVGTGTFDVSVDVSVATTGQFTSPIEGSYQINESRSSFAGGQVVEYITYNDQPATTIVPSVLGKGKHGLKVDRVAKAVLS